MKQDLKKYLIAKTKNSNALVSAKNVVGINCNCVCFECNEDLIAINRIKTTTSF
jgi:hypothetical protein